MEEKENNNYTNGKSKFSPSDSHSNGSSGHLKKKYDDETHHGSTESREVSNQLQSPMTNLLQQWPGAQSLYSLIAALFIVFITFEEVKCYLITEEREKRYNFYSGQFYSFPVFAKIWLFMHLLLYFFVYPVAKYFSNSDYILLVTGLNTIAIIKYTIYYMVKESSISVSLGLALGCESVRIFMKIISFLTECSDEKTRSKVNLGNFTYFLFAPVLIYKSNYEPTSGKINWLRAVSYFTEFLVIVYMNGLWFKNYFEPSVKVIKVSVEKDIPLTLHQLIEIFFVCTLTTLQLYFSIAFGFIHCYFNFAAEALGYMDRNFYKIWWNATSPADMMR